MSDPVSGREHLTPQIIYEWIHHVDLLLSCTPCSGTEYGWTSPVHPRRQCLDKRGNAACSCLSWPGLTDMWPMVEAGGLNVPKRESRKKSSLYQTGKRVITLILYFEFSRQFFLTLEACVINASRVTGKPPWTSLLTFFSLNHSPMPWEERGDLGWTEVRIKAYQVSVLKGERSKLSPANWWKTI